MNGRHVQRLRAMLAVAEDEAAALREAIRELEGKGAAPKIVPTAEDIEAGRRALARKGLLPKSATCEHLQGQSRANARAAG